MIVEVRAVVVDVLRGFVAMRLQALERTVLGYFVKTAGVERPRFAISMPVIVEVVMVVLVAIGVIVVSAVAVAIGIV